MEKGEPGAMGFVQYTRTDEATGKEIKGWETREARASAPTQKLSLGGLRLAIAQAPTTQLPRISDAAQRSTVWIPRQQVPSKHADHGGEVRVEPLPKGFMTSRGLGERLGSHSARSTSTLARVGVFAVLSPGPGKRRK
jgi:hypothetical protein